MFSLHFKQALPYKNVSMDVKQYDSFQNDFPLKLLNIQLPSKQLSSNNVPISEVHGEKLIIIINRNVGEMYGFYIFAFNSNRVQQFNRITQHSLQVNNFSTVKHFLNISPGPFYGYESYLYIFFTIEYFFRAKPYSNEKVNRFYRALPSITSLEQITYHAILQQYNLTVLH